MVSALASPSTTTYYWRAAAKYCVCRPAFVNVTLNCDRRRKRMSTASAASEEKGGDVVVQYVVLRRDLIDTWPLGSVVTQGCHASVAAIWSHKDDPVTLDYCSPENLDSMHKVTLQVKGEAQILNLSEKLKAGGIDHKLWVEQPENIPTCLATKPYPKSVVSSYFKKLQLCKVIKTVFQSEGQSQQQASNQPVDKTREALNVVDQMVEEGLLSVGDKLWGFAVFECQKETFLTTFLLLGCNEKRMHFIEYAFADKKGEV